MGGDFAPAAGSVCMRPAQRDAGAGELGV